MGIVRITYEIITEESAREGEAAERGWEDEEGSEYSVDEVIDLIEECEPSSTQFHTGIWYSSEEEMDMYSGKYKSLSYHLSEFSEEDQRTIFQSNRRWARW